VAGDYKKNMANGACRGSEFLKAWMAHLDEHADLRYPDLAEVYECEEK
jgi:hypothetical protein